MKISKIIICAGLIGVILLSIGIAMPEPEHEPQQELIRISPQDWIKDEQIHTYSDYTRIDGKFTYGFVKGTGSMLPCISPDSTILYNKNLIEGSIKVGDIIVYDEPEGKVIHRIIKIEEIDNKTHYFTKGDNNRYEDSPVFYENITKVVVGILY